MPSLIPNLPTRDHRLDIALSYLFSGALVFTVAKFLLPQSLNDALNAGGWVGSMVSILAVGALIHLIHRRFLGELFLYPLQMRLHEFFSKSASPRGYFKSLGVNSQDCRTAYTESRKLLRETGNGTEDILRGELHMFFVAAHVVMFSVIYSLNTLSFAEAFLWLTAGLILYVGAFYADSKQHEHEVLHFKKHNAAIVKNLTELSITT